jgi:hypothetical protein
MRIRRLLVCAGLLVAVAVNVPRVAAQEPAPTLPADIRAGGCADQGDVVATLNPLVVPEGESQGPNGATPVAKSVTDIPLMVPDMLSATHSVMVYASPEQVGTPMVCGEIGGVVGEDGTLSIGLQAMDGGNESGIASFAPTRKGDGTTVTVNFIAEQRDRERTGKDADGTDEAVDGGADNENSGGEGLDDNHAADGVGNVPVPPTSDQAPAIDGISSLNPNVNPGGLPGANHQPGGNGMVDLPGRDNDGNNGRDRRGNDGVARAGEDGKGSN